MQRLQAGFMRSHLSFRARHDTHASGSVPAPADADGSDSLLSVGMVSGSPHPGDEMRQEVEQRFDGQRRYLLHEQ